MEFLTEYGLFLAKVITFVVAAVVVVSIIVSATQKERGDHEDDGELQIFKLNEKYRKLRESIQAKLMTEQERKTWSKAKRKRTKQRRKPLRQKRRDWCR